MEAREIGLDFRTGPFLGSCNLHFADHVSDVIAKRKCQGSPGKTAQPARTMAGHYVRKGSPLRSSFSENNISAVSHLTDRRLTLPFTATLRPRWCPPCLACEWELLLNNYPSMGNQIPACQGKQKKGVREKSIKKRIGPGSCAKKSETTPSAIRLQRVTNPGT